MLEEFLDVGNKLIEWQSPTSNAAEKKREDFGLHHLYRIFLPTQAIPKKHTLETAE